MKKFLLSIITVILVTVMLVGCGNSVTPLKNIYGDVKSGNGSFVVEKGDYIYFVNGKDDVSASNKFGDVEKSSLVRIKTSDLKNPESAQAETVIPKLLLSKSYKTGVYMYGDYVYYATPSIKKDKKGAVKYNETEFYRFNLKEGKNDSSEIAICKDNTAEYRFIENGGKVYLMFINSETVDEVVQKSLKVYDTETKKEIYTSPVATDILMPENNAGCVYFAKLSEGLDEDTQASFHDVYSYTAGKTEAELVLCGSGSADKVYNDRNNKEKYKDSQFFAESGFQGVTINLIKNSGEFLVIKVATLDANNKSTLYYGFDTKADATLSTKIKLGVSEANSTDKAFTATSYYKSLEEIYYIDNSEEGPNGLVKFNYKNLNDADKTKGRTIISKDCKDYSIQFIEGDYMYLAKTADGIYYRLNLADEDAKIKQINPLAMHTVTEWSAPRVIGNYFIGSYSDNLYKNYIYVVDMEKIDDEPIDGEELNEYEKYLELFSDKENIEKTEVEKLLKTRIGIITEADKADIDKLIEEKYSEE